MNWNVNYLYLHVNKDVSYGDKKNYDTDNFNYTRRITYKKLCQSMRLKITVIAGYYEREQM